MNGLPTAKFVVVAIAPLVLALGGDAGAQTLESFAVLGGSTVTNTGSSVINGNVGVSPGSEITGFPPGIVNAPYTIHVANGVANLAHSQLETTYNNYAGRVATSNLTGQNLGGLVLTPGVYAFESAAELTGTMTLNALNNPNAQFVFIIGSTLTTASASSVLLINGAQGSNVTYVVGSSATLGTETQFAGEILALTSITLNTGADILCGAALALNGAVTLDTNTISLCAAALVDVGDVIDDGTTTLGQTEVANAIDDFIAAGGVLSPEWEDFLAFLSADQLRLALAQIAGGPAGAVAPAGMQATSSFLSQIFGQIGTARGGPGNSVAFGEETSSVDDTQPFPEQPEEPATVRVLGYGPIADNRRSAFPDGALASPRDERLDPSLWNVWAAAHGDVGKADGNALTGASDRSVTTYSLSTGIDYLVLPNTRLGIAVSGGRADFDLDSGYGEGHSDILQAALYGRTDIGAAYVAGALAFAWNDVTTQRFQTMGVSDRFTAGFSAYDISGRIETGYRFALPDMDIVPGSSGITPYAALQVQRFRTDAYSEISASGSNAFALDYAAQTTLATHTEIGVKFDHSLILSPDAIMTLRSRIGWGHDENGDMNATASFQSMPGSSFTVYGPEGASNSLLLSGGAELSLRNGFSLLAMVDGSIAKGAYSYAATASISYAW
ncbi:MAG: ice-binding family protein [Mesorhizobium sp.]|nr:ice-binding family protein [Mesorhizobium sp.]